MILQKAKNWAIGILLAIVAVLAAVMLGQKPQWVKEKEKENEKADKKIKINKAEIKQKDKQIKKADKAVDGAKKDAAKAVQDYAELKKLRDEKLKKAGEDIHVEKPDKYGKQEFDSNADVADYFNDVLVELNGSGDR